ncbi:RBBP9/YdeN family alpha/beta hydrolase [Streptomyces sp. NPDC007088]|uniref:RBBP9/YdeN family alpha/beta hydrolase n=1 Tax=Streptomyces sp. NPDC007088 TaxID=3364773 RepID=UPI00367B90EB
MTAEPTGTSAPTPAAFLVLHGWQNHRPPGHWQHWLAERLGARGHTVDYPQLPDADRPDLGSWLDALRTHRAALPAEGVTVVCHSLACALWLTAAARGTTGSPVDRVLLVSPPSPSFLAGEPEVAAFVPPPVTRARLDRAARSTRLVTGAEDPYCPEGAKALYGDPLGVPTDVLPGAGHISQGEGYGAWDAVLEWCVGGRAALVPR